MDKFILKYIYIIINISKYKYIKVIVTFRTFKFMYVNDPSRFENRYQRLGDLQDAVISKFKW